MHSSFSRARGAVLGALLADALGCPHEFKRSHEIPPPDQLTLVMPDTYRRTYPQMPYGTWSDDGAQLLCLLQSLHDGRGAFDMNHFAAQLLVWRNRAWHQSGGRVFDIGVSTATSLDRLRCGVPVDQCGEAHDRSQGNGSLMRTLPAALLPVLWAKTREDAVTVAVKQSRVTHLHPVAQVSCALYVLLALIFWDEPGIEVADAREQAFRLARRHPLMAAPALQAAMNTAYQFGHEMPTGSGYVLDSLYTALWSLDRGTDYLSAVRLAISLGNDTDTSASITGGLAAIRWTPCESVPNEWWTQLQMPDESTALLDAIFAHGEQGQ